MAEFEFDRSKFEELIVYLAYRLGPEAALGRVKLAKLLLVSDFSAYIQLRRPMTGATYEKWEHGHLPRELLLVQRDLEAEGAIEVETVNYFGRSLKHITARREPNMANFSEDEIGIIEAAIHQFGPLSATYLSELAHQELGWRLASYKEPIPYSAVFLSKLGPSERDIRRGENLASVHGWN
jgi:sarcosine oxidase delta subunit